MEDLLRNRVPAPFCREQPAPALWILTYMDTMQNRPEHKTIAQIEFWKGTMLGVMAGMAIAAFTYDVVDRSGKQAKQLRTRPDQKPDWRTAA